MVFSSVTFLYYFLPILLLIYFVFPSKFKNSILLLFSLFFYYYGEPKYIVILLLSCLINYLFGLLISKKKSKLLLIINILINVGLLFYFKYTNFFIQNINSIFNSNISMLNIVMPIGISFFTFQTLSYVIDVYNGKVKANKNIINFFTYVALFPQLIAGPIVRYADISKELTKRTHSYDNFSYGISRFIIGLSKKVLIANVLGELCSTINGLNASVFGSWLGAICYALQIYFDFSGYSDMAIGLGRIFGFHFLENFNYPFISKSITEFWRRWHISLSSWLRDYIYIPLGGNRVSKIKWYRNIFVVWFVTGFWHGASWNFIIWGLFFAIILILEKNIYGKLLEKHPLIGHIYTIIIIIISFVIFNYTNFEEMLTTIKNMFFISSIPLINYEIIYYLKSYLLVIIIAIISSTPLFKNFYLKLNKTKKYQKYGLFIEPLLLLLLLIIVTSLLIDSSYNPFLYFRF